MERAYYCTSLSGLKFNSMWMMNVPCFYNYTVDKLPPSQFRRDAIARTVHHLTGSFIVAVEYYAESIKFT